MLKALCPRKSLQQNPLPSGGSNQRPQLKVPKKRKSPKDNLRAVYL
jgi:hypothetical protein